MPELPEVETILRGLVPVMEQQVIVHVDMNRADLRWPLPTNLPAQLKGQKICQLNRRSKYILIQLACRKSLLIHLGMSGRILIQSETRNSPSTQRRPEKHDHVAFYMGSGTKIIYNDPRRFGYIDIFPTSTINQHRLLTNLGPEPIGKPVGGHFNTQYLVRICKNRVASIKSILLNQKMIAGLGNIYVCEALFRAGIHPSRQAGHISAQRIRKLVPIIQQVLHDAIDAGGSSLHDYRQANGELGYFQHRFDVYNRENEPCRNRGCPATIERIRQSGRSSFFCPRCQR